jgi:uncharacterized protein YdeI (YjbR/CyaY-like superfamily)
MPEQNPAVDAYIAKAAPFAQPILAHLRKLIHQAIPDVEEAIKWSMPFFVVRGVIVANMAAFKQHCSLGIWGKPMAEKIRADGHDSTEGMGTFGRIGARSDLPGDKQMLAYFREAGALVVEGTRTKSITRPQRVAKPEAEVPAELAAALRKSKAAKATFDTFPPSSRKEYIEWIAEAKRDETRTRRVAQAVEWLAEGKRRNWKHENC